MKRKMKILNGYHTFEVDEYLTSTGVVWRREIKSCERSTKESQLEKTFRNGTWEKPILPKKESGN